MYGKVCIYGWMYIRMYGYISMNVWIYECMYVCKVGQRSGVIALTLMYKYTFLLKCYKLTISNYPNLRNWFVCAEPARGLQSPLTHF